MLHVKPFCPILEVATQGKYVSGFERSGIAWKVGTIGDWMARLWVAGAFDPNRTPEPYPKKAPAGEDRRALPAGGGLKSGQNPTVVIGL